MNETVRGPTKAAIGIRIGVTAFLLAVFAIVWHSHITGALIEKDAGENLQLALNLQHHHIYSRDPQAPFYSTNVREPLPVASIALAVGLVDAALGPAEPSAYFQGQRARYIKWQNAVWMVALCAVTFFSAWTLTGSFYGSLLCVVLINKFPLLPAPVYPYLWIDTLYTELPAATLLLLALTLTILALRRKHTGLAVLAGATFGALALAKAACLYVFICIIVGSLGILLANRRRPISGLITLQRLAFLSLGFAVVVLPWLVRNHVQVGTWQIAGRGGIALHQRAVNNDMTDGELRATLYWWAPDPVTRSLFGHVLHLSDADFLHLESPYRRLSRDEGSDFYEDDYQAFRTGRPQDAISFYFESYAEERQYQHMLEAQGVPNADLVTDKVYGQRGIELMKARPWRQIIETPLFMYRAAAYVFLFLLGTLVYAWRTRSYELAILIVPSLLIVCFYAALTDYIQRYSVPVLPVIAVAGVTLLHRKFFRPAGLAPT